MANVGKAVDVKGLGALPEQFGVQFSGFNLEETKNKISRHDEGGAFGICGPDAWNDPDDDFDITGFRTNDGYVLNVFPNSEVDIPLWTDGAITFNYSEETQSWTMSGVSLGGINYSWKFCNPSAVIDIVVAGLDCFRQSTPAKTQSLEKAIEILAKSINAIPRKTTLAEYAAADCKTYEEEPDYMQTYP